MLMEGGKVGGKALFDHVAAPFVTQALPAMASGALQLGMGAVQHILAPLAKETFNQVVVPGLMGAAAAGVEAGRLSYEHGPGLASAIGAGTSAAGAESANVAGRAGSALFFRLTKLIEEQGARRMAALQEGEQSSSSTSRRKRDASPTQRREAGPGMLGDVARARSPTQEEQRNPVTQQTGFDEQIEHLPTIDAWARSGRSKAYMVEQLAGRRNFMDLLGTNVKDPKKVLSRMGKPQLAQLLVQYDKAHGHI
jgi:hypothetical protein